MRHAVPIEDLLLLLGADAVVLVEEIEEGAFRFFERRVGSSLEVAQIGENTLLELLRVFYGSAKGLESEGQAAYDICTGYVEKVVPA